jgi:Arm DNA-binding domain
MRDATTQSEVQDGFAAFARDCPSFIHQYQAIVTGAVIALGDDRIQFDFKFEGRRYRPTLLITPTALNLRRARRSRL